MSTNFSTFSLEVQRFSEQLVPQQFAVFLKKITLDVLGRLVLRNPVDTGHARLNWQIGVNLTNETELGRVGLDTGVIFTDAAGALNAINDKNPYGIVYIFNNVPYIVRLELGWSNQAPDGFVGITVDEFVSLLQGAQV